MAIRQDREQTMAIKVRPSARIGDYERGVAAERKRIIKLLEDLGTDDGKPFNPFHCDLCLTLASLIALIKGENK